MKRRIMDRKLKFLKMYADQRNDRSPNEDLSSTKENLKE